MISPNDYLVAEERRKDLLRRAAQARLAREAQTRDSRGHPSGQFYGPLLARLGIWLTNWGTSLQVRYGNNETVELLRKAPG